MEGPIEFTIRSDGGSDYAFTRVPECADNWSCPISLIDPAGINLIEIQIEQECLEPTVSHANFIDSFAKKYASELWPAMELAVMGAMDEPDEEGKTPRLTEITVYLPSVLDEPVVWSMQYSFEEKDRSFGMIIDFKNDKMGFACLAD